MNATTTLEHAMDLRGVSKRYADRQVLQDLNLRIAPGSVVGLLGRNGAGKTTLIRSMLGIENFQSGAVSVLGDTANTGLSERVRGELGYVAQDTELFGWMTALQMLRFYAPFYPRWDQALVERLLCEWKLPTKVPITKLSGGERQQLAIVRALAHRPSLLVLDEPVAALDPVARRRFLSQLVEISLERGATVLFSTHIVSDLERVASHVAFLRHGRIALFDEVDGLRESMRRVRAAKSAQLEHGAFAGALQCVSDGQGGWVALVDSRVFDLEALRLAAQTPVIETALGLEDLFLELEA